MHDGLMLQVRARLQGLASNNPAWAQLVMLPKHMGGLGLRSATHAAPFAYLALGRACCRGGHRADVHVAALCSATAFCQRLQNDRKGQEK